MNYGGWGGDPRRWCWVQRHHARRTEFFLTTFDPNSGRAPAPSPSALSKGAGGRRRLAQADCWYRHNIVVGHGAIPGRLWRAGASPKRAGINWPVKGKHGQPPGVWGGNGDIRVHFNGKWWVAVSNTLVGGAAG